MNDGEGKSFKGLLDPIRDLAANWDIDIADSLTEYLDELESLRITIDGQNGSSNVNFATAALLIQGSTAVYSKKVEYLHQLVLQALELITTQKAGSGSNNANPASKQKLSQASILEEERLLFGTESSFLLLDDVVEEGSNINLPQQNQSQRDLERRKSTGRHSTSGAENSRASMMLMHSILQEDHGGSSLRVNSCMMDTSGALMIGGLMGDRNMNRATNFVDLAVAAHGSSSDAAAAQVYGAGIRDDDPLLVRESDDDVFPAAAGGGADGGFESAYNGGGGGWDGPDDDDDDNGDMGGGYDNDNYPGDADDEQNGGRGPVAGTPARNADARAAAMAAAGGGGRGRGPVGMVSAAPTKPNALTLMDPHEVTTGSRNIRKGRTYRIPAAASSFDEENGDDGLNLNFNGDFESTFIALERLKKRLVPLTGLAHSTFAPILRDKKRAEFKKRISQSSTAAASVLSRGLAAVDDDDFFLYRESHHVGENNVRPYGYDDAAAAGGGGGGYGDDGGVDGFWDNGDDDDNDVGDDFGGMPSAHDDGDFAVGQDGEAAAQSAFDKSYRSTNGGGGDDAYSRFFASEEDLALRVEQALNDGLSQSQTTTYEMICRQHIDNFMRGAEQYARETQLSKRVADWTQRLEPVLRAQETAPAFDIYSYSDQVLAQVGAVSKMDTKSRLSDLENILDKENVPEIEATVAFANDTVSFAEIVKSESSCAEVCRVFLACLMLVNQGNLEVITPSQLLAGLCSGSGSASAASFSTEKQSLEKKSSASSNSSRGRNNSANVEKPSHSSCSSSRGWPEFGVFSVRLLAGSRRRDIENFRAPSLDT